MLRSQATVMLAYIRDMVEFGQQAKPSNEELEQNAARVIRRARKCVLAVGADADQADIDSGVLDGIRQGGWGVSG